MTHLHLAKTHAMAACAALIPAAAGGRDSHGGKIDVEKATIRARYNLKIALAALESGCAQVTNQSPGDGGEGGIIR